MVTNFDAFKAAILQAFETASQQETMAEARNKMAEGLATAVKDYMIGRAVTGSAPEGGGDITAQIAGD